MSKFVFFSAADGEIQVSIDQQPVGSARCTEALVSLLVDQGVTFNDDFYCSSSIDFCEEEGFFPGAAGDMVFEATNHIDLKEVDTQPL